MLILPDKMEFTVEDVVLENALEPMFYRLPQTSKIQLQILLASLKLEMSDNSKEIKDNITNNLLNIIITSILKNVSFRVVAILK